MSTFGKVLVILNVLAALAFISVAVMDYGKHQAWAAQVAQEEFVLKGLPVDEKETNADGEVLVNLIGNRMAQQLFTGVGQPVKTQAEEVKKRQSELVNAVNSAEGAQTKKNKLKEIVIPLARSAVERAALREGIDNAKESELGPDGRFLGPDSLFNAAFQEASGQTEVVVEPRRNAIAHFLFCTATLEQYQRTMIVVGLDRYSREVEREATALSDMLPELERVMADEHTNFEKNDHDLLEEIKARGERIQRLQRDLEREKAQLEQYNVLIADRTKDVEELRKLIQTTLEATKAALAKQGDFEKALFAAQKEVATTNAANQRLEGEIKTRELGH